MTISATTMKSPNADIVRGADDGLADYPALARLRLTADEVTSLRRQGTVAREARAAAVYYRLRLRRDGRQITKYIGGRKEAEAVRQDLARLQAARKAELQRAALCRRAGTQLRDAKAALESELIARGFHFHGQAIRRRRAAKNRSC